MQGADSGFMGNAAIHTLNFYSWILWAAPESEPTDISKYPLMDVLVVLLSFLNILIRKYALEKWDKIAERNISNLRYADDTTFMAESEEELKILLLKMKEESEKVGLKLNIQKTKIMASGPITSWKIDGETVETVSDFTFWPPKSL